MRKRHPFSRREFRKRRNYWLRRNIRGVLLLIGLLSLFVAGTSLPLLTSGVAPGWWYLLGVLHAGAIVTAGAGVLIVFLVHEREAISDLRGAWGEDNTGDVLKQARRQQLVWGWVDSIGLQRGDLDHFVVTRNGGLVVIDSKWRSTSSAHTAGELVASANRVRTRAEGVARTVIAGRQRARHRARTNPLAVRPVVVVWGGMQSQVPSPTHVNGIDVVPGRDLLGWLESLEGHSVSEDAAEEFLQRLRAWVAQRNPSKRVVPPIAATT